MKKLFSLSMPAILAALFTSSVAQSKNPKVECLIGVWVPDITEIQSRLKANSTAAQVKFSGSLSMIIREINQSKGVEFRADGWSFFQNFKDSDDTTLVVDGSARYSLSAPSGGEFHFAEQSSDYAQKIVVHYKNVPELEIKQALTRDLLPIGEWANGTWKCSGDVIKFQVRSEDDDGYLSRTWNRQKQQSHMPDGS